VAQAEEHLPSKCEVLNSNPSTIKKKKEKEEERKKGMKTKLNSTLRMNTRAQAGLFLKQVGRSRKARKNEQVTES
jgi:hypothetical protein